MVKTIFKVVALDAVVLAALASVLNDLAWRVSYASSPHASTTGYAASFTYSVLTRVFSMAGGPLTLTSPPTLDWVQLLSAVLVVVNGWFAYTILASRRLRPAPVPSSAQARN